MNLPTVLSARVPCRLRCSPRADAPAGIPDLTKKRRYVAIFEPCDGCRMCVDQHAEVHKGWREACTDDKGKETIMITPGTLLMDKDTPRPQCFQLEDDPSPNAWMSVKHTLTLYELEKELATAGWTFFYMAGTIRTTAFGFDRAKMIHAAVKRLIRNVTLQKCNCLEIDEVATHSFLGMPYVSISAHARHVQKRS